MSRVCACASAMKEVFVQFSGRSKSVRFESLPGQSDVSALRAKLDEAALRDQDLQTRMLNCTVVFQRERVKSNGDIKLVDLEEDEEIIHESDLHIVFATILTSTLFVTNETPPCSPETETESKSLIEVEIVSVDGTDTSPDLGSQPLCSPPSSGVKIMPQTPASSSSSSASSSSSRKKSTKKEMASPASRPFSLPTLTDHLKSLESVITSDSKPFIKFYGDAMRTWCNDSPSQGDYDVVGKAIVKRHPGLEDKTANRPHGIVCSLLSMYIRNAKAREKKAKKSLALSDDTTDAQLNPPPAKRLKFSVPEKQSSGLTDEDMAVMDNELRKLESDSDTPHVKRLLRDSYPLRREWITSAAEDTRPANIIKRFPHLKNVSLLLQELRLRLTMTETLESLVDQVDNLFLKISNELNEVYGETDEEKLNFIISLYNRLKPKNVPKKFPDLVTVKEGLSSLGNDLTSNEMEGARSVMYLSDNTISVAFVIADSLKFKIEKPTVSKCVLSMAAFYHAFDRTYPTAYKSFFALIDEFVFKLKIDNAAISYKIFKKNFLSNLI